MNPVPGWYADPLDPSTLRLWNGVGWTDRIRPRETHGTPLPSSRGQRPRRTVLVDAITVVVVMAFVVGTIEMGWRKTAVVSYAVAAATQATQARQPVGSGTIDQAVTVAQGPTPAAIPTPAAAGVHGTSDNALRRTTPASPSGSVDSSNPRDYTLTGIEWDPCNPVTVASTGPDVAGIVAELSSVTGLRLQMVSGSADIEVAWGQVSIPHAIGATQSTSRGTFFVHVDITITPRGPSSLPIQLRHEFGHALGLGHVDQRNEIMYPTLLAGSPTDYQAGDRAGLKAVGASNARC